ncbi:MAG: asparagine synthase-related protein [Candidatus Micrarchaeota archaeon]
MQKRELLASMLGAMEHRGDKKNECRMLKNCLLGAHRLAIVDRENARQPMPNEDNSIFVVFNGEIYNHGELRSLLGNHGFRTDSDTEVLVHGYEEWGPDLLQKLDGQFAFIIYDSRKDVILAARDPFGIKPFHYAEMDGCMAFASEMKALAHLNAEEIKVLEPGACFLDGKIHRYFRMQGSKPPEEPGEIKKRLRTLFREAVRKRVQIDLPVAVLVSGGVDSTLVLKYALECHQDVTAFCVGGNGSEDLSYARRVAEYFGVELKVFDPKMIDVEKELEMFIYFGETFEPNQVNTLGLSYYLAKMVHDCGIKVALSGEGADEIFGGYSEFRQIRSEAELQARLMEYLRLLHRTQLQRVDRMSMAHGVEVRVPFLDKELVEYAMGLPPSLKVHNNTTKWILREAFRSEVPEFVIGREKCPFPVGAGRRREFEQDEYAKLVSRLSDGEFSDIRSAYPEFSIRTKEDAFYFRIFAKYFLKGKFNRERIGMVAR